MSDLSPLDRLRTQYEARQSSRTEDIPIWADGSLVARIGMVDTKGARDSMRTMMRLLSDEAGELTEHDLAVVVASATRGLFTPGDDGRLEPLADEHGPLSFDRMGAALGFPEVDTPEGGVIVALTEGDPPTVNSVLLLTIAMRIAAFLQGADVEPAVSGS